MNGVLSDIFQSLIGNVYSWIIKPFADLRTLNSLFYGKDGDTELAYGIFTNKEITDIYMPGMNAFVAIAVTAILVGIVLSGMKIASTGINPSNRTYVIEFFKDLLIVGLVLFNLSTLYQVIFGLNYSIINVFHTEKQLMALPPSLDITKGVIGILLINLVLLGLWIWANFYYMMRKLTLLLLMIMGPLMIALYLIPQTKAITGAWLKELIGTVMVQSVHAALYWIIALMSTNTDNGVEAIILYVIFIPVSESLRSLIGLGGQMNDRFTKSAAMFGGAALAGLYGSVRGAMNGKSVAESLRNAAGQASKALGGSGGDGKDDKEGSKQLLNNAGTDTGSTTRAERMLKAGEIFSKGGKAVFGAAGAVAGVPMGPMGSIAMSTMGFNTGGVVGGLAGRSGQALVEGGARRVWEGTKAGINKFKGVKNAEAHADEKMAQSLADNETTKWAETNEKSVRDDLKSGFPDADIDHLWNNTKKDKHDEFLKEARNTVGQLRKANGQHAKASDLVDSTVNRLTNDWTKNNKEQFMQDYETKNPLPPNATEGEIVGHNQNKESAWQSAVSGKRQDIQNIASKTADTLGNKAPSDISFINKDDFVNKVGQEVSSVMGIGSREATMAIKGATSSVKKASLYSGKSVNTEYLTNQLASMQTESGKENFIKEAVDSGKAVNKNEALQQWNQVEAPKRFQQNLSQIGQSMPRHIPLDHRVLQSKVFQSTAGRIAGASGYAVASFLGGTTGVKEIGQFVADTRIGQGAFGFSTGLKQGFQNSDMSQGVITGTAKAISTPFSNAASHFKNHMPSNVIEKQSGFKNAIAYATGIVGGVAGYKAGTSFASGGTSVVSRAPGSLKFGFNPYNNAVNKQISEVSDIAHMAQTVGTGPNGEQTIASGAVRMVTTASQTVIQVRDKTGNVQTVSRMASGDSSLKKGQTIYQDLTIQNGSLVPASNVYQEDSGGGKVTLNRSINVNPNKIVGNRNTPKNPRVVQEVQSYNQKVDSGQYHVKDAINEMTNIQMVVDRNRSYMVGSKEGQQYRISSYGPGDARLNTEEVVYRKYEVRNKKLVYSTTHKDPEGKVEFDYTNSIDPIFLMNPPNKRNAQRQQLEKFRHKSFTESLR
jgi:hypothetical protein